MSEINFIPLIDLLNNYPDKVETIKIQYLDLLSELTLTEYIETSLFKKNVERINEMGKIIVGAINNISTNEIELVASGTIIIEPKIIRKGKNVGHIEDIVISKNMRGKGISQDLLNILKVIAKNNNCYKIILDCDSTVKNVYIKNGLDIKGIQMAEYFL
jgi:glucosamine-phosphate N-acetyltransferase